MLVLLVLEQIEYSFEIPLYVYFQIVWLISSVPRANKSLLSQYCTLGVKYPVVLNLFLHFAVNQSGHCHRFSWTARRVGVRRGICSQYPSHPCGVWSHWETVDKLFPFGAGSTRYCKSPFTSYPTKWIRTGKSANATLYRNIEMWMIFTSGVKSRLFLKLITEVREVFLRMPHWETLVEAIVVIMHTLLNS